MEENGREYQFDNTKEALASIDLIQEIIAEREQEIKRLKQSLEGHTTNLLRSAARLDSQAADELATYVYWFYDKYITSMVICKFYDTYPQRVQEFIGVATLKVKCRDCGNPFDEVLRSRSHLKDRLRDRIGICPECQEKRKSASTDYQAQYQAEQLKKQQIIQALRSMPYAEYLKTEHWQNVRAQMLKRFGYRCQVCNAKNVSLHVHHRTYENRGDERWGDLIVLCAGCHSTFHTNGNLSHD